MDYILPLLKSFQRSGCEFYNAKRYALPEMAVMHAATYNYGFGTP